MNKPARLVLGSLALLALTACTYLPKLGMRESRFVRNSFSSDLVYIEGDVKAYRYSGSYYYFKAGRLAQVSPSLVAADQIQAFEK